MSPVPPFGELTAEEEALLREFVEAIYIEQGIEKLEAEANG